MPLPSGRRTDAFSSNDGEVRDVPTAEEPAGTEIQHTNPTYVDYITASPPTASEVDRPAPAADALQRLRNSRTTEDIDSGLQSRTETKDMPEKLYSRVERANDATQDILDASDGLIQAKLDSFFEGVPWLLNALDEVAKIHPVVSIVAITFKAVYTMELKRRDNERCVTALYVEMKDMVHVLISLGDIKDPLIKDHNGVTLESRLEIVCRDAACDMVACANVCDAYRRKHPVTRVFRSLHWQTKLADFMAKFSKHRSSFNQALAIHTARLMNDVRTMVAGIEHSLESLGARFSDLFRSEDHRLSDEHVVILKSLRESTNDTADDKYKYRDILQEMAVEGRRRNPNFKQDEALGSMRTNLTIKELQRELCESVDQAIDNNTEAFQRKYALHREQLPEELPKLFASMATEMTDRLMAGPHDRIKNEELREIWKDMNWRRNVKVQQFVMTLRDHFQDKIGTLNFLPDPPKQEATLSVPEIEFQGTGNLVVDSQTSDPSATSMALVITGQAAVTHGQESKDRGIQKIDDWPFEYMNFRWMPQIMEAFDDDGSGFVSINEVNQLTDSLPRELGWSLPHWIAYWAIGWQACAIWYRDEIDRLFRTMFKLLLTVKPENQSWANLYLIKIWPYVTALTMGLHDENVPPILYRFQAYKQMEETRIKKNLEGIQYEIDGLDTVHVVTGGVRIEKRILPLVYLLLKRDIKMFYYAQEKVLIEHTVVLNAVRGLREVQLATHRRVRELEAQYKQQRLDPVAKFDHASCGLFRYFHGRTHDLWSLSKVREINAVRIAQPRKEQDLTMEDLRENCPEVGLWGDRLSTSPASYTMLYEPDYSEFSVQKVLNIGISYINVEAPLQTLQVNWFSFSFD
ncbi:hypothetical protein K474DRAFT_1704774 [Panus rudis PR-1116 ss-1]|nr:hypothetical protein K474DRAFT_1704774 [Panus rudis PR-1116 ss-1]